MLDDLEQLAAPVVERFEERHRAREAAYGAARDAIRSAARAIRALHRDDLVEADKLLGSSREHLDQALAVAEPHEQVFHSGFLQDAMQEYAEARITAAVLREEPVPSPQDLGVDDGSWLHGLADVVGECRRACLDDIRSGHLDRAEGLLETMQQIMSVLMAVDAPDAITRGLRRKADSARSITERTRGDLTAAVGRAELRAALDAHRGALERSAEGP